MMVTDNNGLCKIMYFDYSPYNKRNTGVTSTNKKGLLINLNFRIKFYL